MKKLSKVKVCLLMCAALAVVASPALGREYDTMMAGQNQWLEENYEYETGEAVEDLPSAVEDEDFGPLDLVADTVEGAWIFMEDVVAWLLGGEGAQVSMTGN